MKIMMEAQAKLISEQSALLNQCLGMYYNYFKEEAAEIKEVIIYKI